MFEVNMKSLQHSSKAGADVLSGDLQSGRGTCKKVLLSSYTRVMRGHRITGYSELEGTHWDHQVQTEMAELPLLQELHLTFYTDKCCSSCLGPDVMCSRTEELVSDRQQSSVQGLYLHSCSPAMQHLSAPPQGATCSIKPPERFTLVRHS